jgi:hypothetical protein
MASSYTTNLRIEKPGNNDYVNTWNVPINANFDVIDQALGGVTFLNATGAVGTVTLLDTQYRSLILLVSGAQTGNAVYSLPAGVGGQWIVRNTTTGAFTVTISSAGGGASIAIPQGGTDTVYCDGTNVRTAKELTTIPAGLISMWSGSIASIPGGWALCDGANGTPDLRDRFLVGAGGLYNVGATGGSKDAIVVAHAHTGTTASAGAHTHTYVEPTFGQHPTGSGSFEQRGANTNGTTGSAGAHTHALNIDSAGSSGADANLPPYYALAYIMKL